MFSRLLLGLHSESQLYAHYRFQVKKKHPKQVEFLSFFIIHTFHFSFWSVVKSIPPAVVGLTSAVVGLTSAVVGLTSTVEGLTSAGVGLTSAGVGLTSAVEGLTSAVEALTSPVKGLISAVVGLTSTVGEFNFPLNPYVRLLDGWSIAWSAARLFSLS